MVELRLEGFPKLRHGWDAVFISDDADHLDMVIIGLQIDCSKGHAEQGSQAKYQENSSLPFGLLGAGEFVHRGQCGTHPQPQRSAKRPMSIVMANSLSVFIQSCCWPHKRRFRRA